jgi:hypothetical protein
MFPFIALTYIHRWQGKKPHVFNLNLHLKLKKCHITVSAQQISGLAAGARLIENKWRISGQEKVLTAA